MTVKRVVLTTAALIAGVLASSLAGAQTVALQQKLVAQDGVAGAQLGSVGVDGNTAVVGAFGDTVGGNIGQGSAYVYVNAAGTWMPSQKLTAADGRAGDNFGRAVGISGNTIVVGAHQADLGTSAINQGAVYVFVWSGTSWVQQAKLVASDASGGDLLGEFVRIDGDTVIAGARRSDRPSLLDVGAAYVFERTGSTWAEHKLTALDGVAGDEFGMTADVSGATVCVGAWFSDGQRGSVYIYVRGGAGWSLQRKILAPDGQPGDWLGTSCAIDGDTVVAGARGDDTPQKFDEGSAYVYVRSGTTWALQEKLLPDPTAPTSVAAAFGESVAIHGDRLIVGAVFEFGYGTAYLYGRVGASWTGRQKIAAGDGLVNDFFGDFVSLDATTVFVGAFGDDLAANSNQGSAYVFGVPAGAPGAPTNFQASANGNTISMSWGAPSSGTAPTGYTVVARTPGGALLGSAPVGSALSLTVPGVPNGVFVLSALATNASGPGPESTAVTVTVPNVPAPPGPPTNLTVAVVGNTASFAWSAPASGGPVAGYVLVAGATPGFTVPLGSAPLPAAPAGLVVPGVPPGTFYARVVAQNSGGASGASNEVAFTVAGASAPAPPTLNAPVVSGSTVTLSWAPGSGGGAPTSYVLSVTGAVVADAPLSGTSVTVPGVPSGTYFLRLVAVNGVGPSPPSAQVTLVVP